MSAGSLPRLLVLALVVAGLGALSAWLVWPERPLDPEDRAGPGACATCHADLVAEWRASGHAQAWENPALHAEAIRVQQGLADCVACHAPAPLLATEGTPPPARAVHQPHGVDCTACHARPDGRVGAARTVSDAPCRPVATPALSASATCGRCHRAVHEDWVLVSAKGETRGCVECHMAAVARDGGRAGRHHGHRPSRDAAEIAKGLRVTVRVVGRELHVAVANITAHNVPGERHFRQLHIDLQIRDAAGVITFPDRRFIRERLPFRGERRDDHLAAGEVMPFAWTLTEPHGRARVRLLYQPLPSTREDDLTVIFEATVEF